MTNNLRGKKLSILKCPDCQDGYLIVKMPKNGAQCFLGCSNYNKSGHGCNKTLSMRDYYKMMKYDLSGIDQSDPVNSVPGEQTHVSMVQKDERQTGNKDFNKFTENRQTEKGN